MFPPLTCLLPRRRIASIAAALFLTTFALLVVFQHGQQQSEYTPSLASWLASASPKKLEADDDNDLPFLSLPELEYIATTQSLPSEQFCTERFTSRYLQDLRDHSFQYCDPGSSKSKLTCFHAHARSDGGIDSFCLGSGAALHPGNDKFTMDCTIRTPRENDTKRGIPAYGAIAASWMHTGAHYLLRDHVTFAASSSPDSGHAARTEHPIPPAAAAAAKDGRFLLMVRREGNHNLWHSMMEIWSMTMSFDVLRLSRDPDSPDGAAPYYRFPEDLENTQVVVVDDFEQEPFFDLWSLYSRHPIVRLADILKDPAQAAEFASPTNKLVFPLSGGSNPLWQNDWAVRGNCRDAPLLSLYVQRVFQHVGLTHESGPRPTEADDKQDITVTFIDRQGTRKLLGAPALLASLAKNHTDIRLRSVDLAELSFVEQLKMVQETDILVGVHGAGLTHSLFMREGAGAIVEIQPEAMGHKGFRNLAAMRGQKYFMAQATIVEPEEDGQETGESSQSTPTAAGTGEGKASPAPVQRREGHWQTSDVRIEEDRFLALMDAAIKSLYNEGLRSHDVI